MSEEDRPIRFSEDQRRLFKRIAEMVRRDPASFREAGRWLDAAEGLPGSAAKLKGVRDRCLRDARDRRHVAKRTAWFDDLPDAKIRHLREKKMLTPDQAAAAAGFADAEQWLLVERDRPSNIKMEALRKIATALGVMPRQLRPGQPQGMAQLLTARYDDPDVVARARREEARQIRENRAKAQHPPSKFEIAAAAASVLLDEPPNFDALRPDLAELFARRVVLVVWILTDPGDLSTDRQMTHLQNWEWGAFPSEWILGILDVDAPAEKRPQEMQRVDARRMLFDDRLDDWMGLTQKSLRVLDELEQAETAIIGWEPAAVPAKDPPTSTAGSLTPTDGEALEPPPSVAVAPHLSKWPRKVDVAKVLNVERGTVTKMCADGRLTTATDTDGVERVDPASVIRLQLERQTSTEPNPEVVVQAIAETKPKFFQCKGCGETVAGRPNPQCSKCVPSPGYDSL